MPSNLDAYRTASAALPEENRLWPLYGAGFENLGVDGGPLDVPLAHPGPGELLVRHDAAGICTSDIKVIRIGEQHHYVHHNMRERPVVLGHEVTLTVIEVGTELQANFRPGDRFIVQPAILNEGTVTGYGFELQGGFSRHSIVDRRVFAGDDGSYLVPVHPGDGYAEVALCEPWSCVEARAESISGLNGIFVSIIVSQTGLPIGGPSWFNIYLLLSSKYAATSLRQVTVGGLCRFHPRSGSYEP